MSDEQDKSIKQAGLEIAVTASKVLKKEQVENAINDESSFDLFAMNEPGTVIWTDPKTGEERHTKPGDKMYSTAMIFAKYVIDNYGNKIEW